MYFFYHYYCYGYAAFLRLFSIFIYGVALARALSLLHCTKSHIFFFKMFWKDSHPKKNWTGIWSFLYHQERWYLFSPKMWYYSLGRKWKMVLLKKNTWKYDIFSKFSEQMVSQKKLHWNTIFLYHKERRHFFFPKIWWFFSERKMKDDLSQKIPGNMFSVCLVKVVFLFPTNMKLLFC